MRCIFPLVSRYRTTRTIIIIITLGSNSFIFGEYKQVTTGRTSRGRKYQRRTRPPLPYRAVQYTMLIPNVLQSKRPNVLLVIIPGEQMSYLNIGPGTGRP